MLAKAIVTTITMIVIMIVTLAWNAFVPPDAHGHEPETRIVALEDYDVTHIPSPVVGDGYDAEPEAWPIPNEPSYTRDVYQEFNAGNVDRDTQLAGIRFYTGCLTSRQYLHYRTGDFKRFALTFDNKVTVIADESSAWDTPEGYSNAPIGETYQVTLIIRDLDSGLYTALPAGDLFRTNANTCR